MGFWSRLIAVFLLAIAVVNTMAGESDTAVGDTFRWRKNRIPIAFSTSLIRESNAIKAESDIQGAILKSLAVWEEAADVQFDITWTALDSASPHGKSGDGINLVTTGGADENVLMFSGGNSEAAARSRVFYNGRGEISEADIVFNPYQEFSTDGTFGTFDFESVLTHEIGHLLGLDHSPLPGSTMFESHGRNGTFSIPGYSPRTLSEADRANARALYGSSGEDSCCGTIEGRLSTAQRIFPASVLWAEDAGGRVTAAAEVGSDGLYRLKGLRSGNYRLFVQDMLGKFGGTEIGPVSVQKAATVVRNKRVAMIESGLGSALTGFNGQLSDLPVVLNSGRRYRILLGTRVGDLGIRTIYSTSPHLAASKISGSPVEFGDSLSVFNAQLNLSPATPRGDYTIVVRAGAGVSVYLPGRLTVEEFINPWIVFGDDQLD